MLCWSSLWISRALQMNKSWFGEIHAFRGKNDRYWLWALPWKFGDKIKLNRMKFVLFMILGTYTLSMDWVAFFF